MKIVKLFIWNSHLRSTQLIWLFQVELKGLTNLIKFDNQGFRTDFVLDIVELSSVGMRKIGDWNSTQGVNFTRTFGEQQTEIVDNLKNKTLIITMILVSVMAMQGNDEKEKSRKYFLPILSPAMF